MMKRTMMKRRRRRRMYMIMMMMMMMMMMMIKRTMMIMNGSLHPMTADAHQSFPSISYPIIPCPLPTLEARICLTTEIPRAIWTELRLDASGQSPASSEPDRKWGESGGNSGLEKRQSPLLVTIMGGRVPD